MKKSPKWFMTSILFLLSLSVSAAPQKLSIKERKDVIESIGQLLKDNYVFPETAEAMSQSITEKLNNKAYQTISDPIVFAEQLTKDLRAISNDLHLRIMFDPERVSHMRRQQANPADLSLQNESLRRMERDNYGFKEIKIMDGNIGYLNLTSFFDAQYGGETAVAAMNYLANADALIIDLRRNGGGSPSMIQLITSYLYDSEPVHLNTFYWRPSDTYSQTWTLPHVQGKRRPDRDVYVLTSRRTFSAAEEFSYNLKHLERATLVGETTGGGAHPGGSQIATDRFLIWMPNGRAINPITNTNWEGVGVIPHIKTKADEALTVAYQKALEKLSNSHADAQGDLYRWYLQRVNAERNPVSIDGKTLNAYSGKYGPRTISFENGSLYYQREGRNKFKMTPLTDDTFSLDGMDDFRIQIIKKNGKVAGLRGLYDNGSSDETPKDSE